MILKLKTFPSWIPFYLAVFPVASILAFLPTGFGSYLMRATASYSYEELVAAALQTYANTSLVYMDSIKFVVFAMHRAWVFADHPIFSSNGRLDYYSLACL